MTNLPAKYCYRHTSRATLLTCGVCDRAACTSCIVNAPVGVKCKSCLNQSVPDDLKVGPFNIFLSVALPISIAFLTGILVAGVFRSTIEAVGVTGGLWGIGGLLQSFVLGSMMYITAFFNSLAINYMTRRKISTLFKYKRHVAIASMFLAPISFWLFFNYAIPEYTILPSYFLQLNRILFLAIGTFLGIGLIMRTVR